MAVWYSVHLYLMNGHMLHHQITFLRWYQPRCLTLFLKLFSLKYKTGHQIIDKNSPQSSEVSCRRQTVQMNLNAHFSFFAHLNSFLIEIIIINDEINQCSHPNASSHWSTWDSIPTRTAADVTGGGHNWSNSSSNQFLSSSPVTPPTTIWRLFFKARQDLGCSNFKTASLQKSKF